MTVPTYIDLTKYNEWYTPKYIVDYFGKFDYDPATTKKKADEFDIKHYDTIETDGLKANWNKYRRIWINPPFTLKREFLKKAVETFNRTGAEIYVVIPVAYLTTKSFYQVVKGGVIYLPNGRFKFERGDGLPAKSPALGTIIIKIDNKWSVKTIKLEEL